MRLPRPWMADLIGRRGLSLVPDPVEPDPHIPDPLTEPARVDQSVAKHSEAGLPTRPVSERRCGACDVPEAVHGIRYAHEVGHHEWIGRQP